MSRVEDEIVKQLHLCAALMSDPQIMLNQSAFVADQFVVSMNKIEQLQNFMRIPDDPCARHNWLDSSIITSGVKRMVVAVLSKHMEPLRWKTPKQMREAKRKNDRYVENAYNSAPKIFSQKFDKTEAGRSGHSGDETLVAREIKETNCMAALVLLYYYLYWHVLLILLNRANHPCTEGHETNGLLDLDKLMHGLPGFADTFELRGLRQFMHTDHSAAGRERAGGKGDTEIYSSDDDTDHGSDDDDASAKGVDDYAGRILVSRTKTRAMIDALFNGAKMDTFESNLGSASQDANDGFNALDGFMSSVYPDDSPTEKPRKGGPPKRKGNLISIYRMIVALTNAGEESDHVINNAFVACFGSHPEALTAESTKRLTQRKLKEDVMLVLGPRITQSRIVSTVLESALNAKCYSVYNLQDDALRWFDLWKPIETKSCTSTENEDYGEQPVRMQSSHILAEVLDSKPYSECFMGDSLEQMKMLAIHDFGSASLMMDVCRSHLKLYEMLLMLMKRDAEHQLIGKALTCFVMQGFMPNKSVSKFLKSKVGSNIFGQEHKAKTNAWLSIPVGNYKKAAFVEEDTLRFFTIDEIAGYYWGSRLCNLSTSNHRYFAWPDAEVDTYRHVLDVIQYILHNSDTDARKRISVVLLSGLRNSLFVRPVSDSFLMLLDKLDCSPFFKFGDTFLALKSSDILQDLIPDTLPTFPGSKLSRASAMDKKPLASADGGSSEGGGGGESPPESRESTATEVTAKFDRFVDIQSFRFRMDRTKLLRGLRFERAALQSREKAAGSGVFKLYCGTSWPVAYHGRADGVDGSEKTENNYKVFRNLVRIPRVLGSRLENGIELIAHHLTETAAASREIPGT